MGCGGDEPSAPAAPEDPPPLTKAQFIYEADRICFSAESQIEAAADDFATQEEPDPREVRRIVTRVVVPKLRAEAQTIRLLEPPVGDEDEVEAILAATERGADALEGDPEAALDGLPAPLREAERLARAYGSRQCGLRE
ncbi:MAG: hypothetical protein ACR2G3_01875 [Solirubrobacterales bacterium]